MSRQKPTNVFLSCSAGGIPAGVFEGMVLSAFEEKIHAPLLKLIDGVNVASAASTVITPTLIRHPQNPDLPLFTMRESYEAFKREAPIWVSDHVNPAAQLLSSYGLRIPFTKSAFHYNDDKIDQSIERQIGHATMEDIATSYFIPAHRISTLKAREAAVSHYKIIREDGSEYYNVPKETRLKDLIRATTAVPGLFKSARIGEDSFCDFGHLDDAHLSLIRFQKSRTPEKEIHFIAIAPPRYHGYMSPSVLDKIGIIRQSMHLARSTSMHSYASTLGICEELIGADHVHDLSMDIDIGKVPHRNALRSILDASTTHFADLEEMAHKFILSDEFNRACDLLGENFQAKTAPAPELPSALANAIIIKKPHAGIMEGMRSLIFGLKKPPEAAPLLH